MSWQLSLTNVWFWVMWFCGVGLTVTMAAVTGTMKGQKWHKWIMPIMITIMAWPLLFILTVGLIGVVMIYDAIGSHFTKAPQVFYYGEDQTTWYCGGSMGRKELIEVAIKELGDLGPYVYTAKRITKDGAKQYIDIQKHPSPRFSGKVE